MLLCLITELAFYSSRASIVWAAKCIRTSFLAAIKAYFKNKLSAANKLQVEREINILDEKARA